MLLALLLATAQPADGIAVPGWRIHASEPICFMETIYRDGTYLKIEYHPRQDLYYMLLANEAWQDIESRKRYDIQIRGNGYMIDTSGSGIRDEEHQRGIMHIPLVSSEALRRNRTLKDLNSIENILRRADRLTVRREGGEWLNLQLTGAPLAHWKTIECAARFSPGGKPMARYRVKSPPRSR